MTATRRTPPAPLIAPDSTLCTKRAAMVLAELGAPLSPTTMVTYRNRTRHGRPCGPRFSMVDGRARYSRADLEAFAAQRREGSK